MRPPTREVVAIDPYASLVDSRPHPRARHFSIWMYGAGRIVLWVGLVFYIYVQSYLLAVVQRSAYQDACCFGRFLSHAGAVGVPDGCLFACWWFCIFCLGVEFPGRRCFRSRCEAGESTETSEFDAGQDRASDSLSVSEEPSSILRILKGSNSFLPHVAVASTFLALFYPPSFSWFTNRYYAPALGFLMFAVGVNSSERDFLEAFKRPAAIFAGYIGQFIIKPLLGYMFGILAVSIFALPTPIGAGIMLVSCVSGAQLSNYATFLTDPPMAPLSIVMTSLSTASAVFVTPFLSLLLIGKRLPVDVKGMVSSILQIVVAPIAAGLLLNRFFPWICNAIRPFLPPLSVLVTACCIGAPLAINVERIVSPFGLKILLLIIAFHLCAFIIGYLLPGVVFRKAPDVKALQRTLSYETGMQSSLLALALANKFFQDPLVAVPPAISTVMMSVMGFSLVLLWAKKNTAS